MSPTPRAAPVPPIAPPEEVLRTLTAMLRGENDEKPSEQLKAAESLAKHYGILTPKEDSPALKPGLASEIEAAMRSLEARDESSRP